MSGSQTIGVGDISSMVGAGILTRSDQRNQRIDMTAEDQFGRPWALIVEKETQEPTCKPTPAGWTDHLQTPSKYVKIPKGRHGQRKLGEVFVDFPTWIDEQKQAEQAYDDLKWKVAELKFPNNLPKPEELDTHPIIVNTVGVAPWPSSAALTYISEHADEPIAKEILGLAGELSIEAQVLLGVAKTKDLLAHQETAPKRYQEFLAWAIAKGKAKNFTAAAALWTDMKKTKEG